MYLYILSYKYFFIFNLKTLRLSNCLSSNGTKSQIFGPKKDSDSGKQSELAVFQKYYSYEDYKNLSSQQIFLLEYLDTCLYEF